MKTKPLVETNPYLKDSVTMRDLIAHSVKTSCGVEGIKINPNAQQLVITTRREKRIYKTDK